MRIGEVESCEHRTVKEAVLQNRKRVEIMLKRIRGNMWRMPEKWDVDVCIYINIHMCECVYYITY